LDIFNFLCSHNISLCIYQELILLKWPSNDFKGLSCRCVQSNSFRNGSPIRIDWNKYINDMKILKKGKSTGRYNGDTVRAQAPWSPHKNEYFSIDDDQNTMSLYDRIVDIDPYSKTNQEDYLIMTRSVVDSDWGKSLPKDKVFPNGMSPQSNLVKRRTDSTWSKTTKDGCHRKL
jgi:hypothetical protein